MAYFLRTTEADGKSYGGFQWPREVGAVVEAPDWNAKPKCGGGLHGLRDGLGSSLLLDWLDDALWWIVEADDAGCIDLGDNWKFPRCKVVAFGQRHEITARLHDLRPGPIHGLVLTGGDGSQLTGGAGSTLTGGDGSMLTGGSGSILTGGYGSQLTGGYWSTLTGGDGSTLTGGAGSTLTGGDGSMLTGGSGSILTGGYGSTLIFLRWIDGRRRALVAYVGEDGIKASVAYRANDDHTAVVEAT